MLKKRQTANDLNVENWVISTVFHEGTEATDQGVKPSLGQISKVSDYETEFARERSVRRSLRFDLKTIHTCR